MLFSVFRTLLQKITDKLLQEIEQIFRGQILGRNSPHINKLLQQVDEVFCVNLLLAWYAGLHH